MAKNPAGQKCGLCGSSEHEVTRTESSTLGGVEVLTAPCVPKDAYYFMTSDDLERNRRDQ